MPTLPTTGGDLNLVKFAVTTQPGYTHKLDIAQDHVHGMTDGRDALYQAIYLILNVERYAYPIYSWNYGAELTDLIGKSKDYAISEIKRRVTEALEQDDRIIRVDDWSFEAGRNWIHATFTAYTIYGELTFTQEVSI